MANCEHARTTDISEHCYTGSVAGIYGDENRAAHGGVCVTVECRSCGARRGENRNGRHVEVGAWGLTREQREAKAREAARVVSALVERRPGDVTLRSDSGAEATVGVDREGYLVVRGAKQPDGQHIYAAVPALVDYARELRAAHVHAEKLRDAVA